MSKLKFLFKTVLFFLSMVFIVEIDIRAQSYWYMDSDGDILYSTDSLSLIRQINRANHYVLMKSDDSLHVLSIYIIGKGLGKDMLFEMYPDGRFKFLGRVKKGYPIRYCFKAYPFGDNIQMQRYNKHGILEIEL